MAERSKTYALVVGVERYDASERDWSLDGPASDARRMVDWLLKSDVPKERIRVLLSNLDRNLAVREEVKACLGVEPGGTRSEDVKRELIKLRSVSADIFFFYWGGHGWSTTRGDRCLFCSDTTLQAFEHLDLGSLMEAMRTDWYRGLSKQVFLVDACANFAPQRGNRPPRYDFGGGKPLAAIEQFALFGAKPGQASKNVDELKTGLFSSELFEEMGEPAKDGQWPLDFPAIGFRLRQRFEDLKKTGKATQTPSQFWFRDSATGDEGFYGMSPLTELQGLLTDILASDESKMALARAWYVRSLRHVPTATDRDRNPGERSIADMVSSLDDWRQQPTGELPLLIFTYGLAEKALTDAERQQVKTLTARRAREKGLGDMDIETAQARLRIELQNIPDALQVYLLPEGSELPATDPQMTFKISLYTWEGGGSSTPGASALVGEVTGLTLRAAQEYLNRRLVTDLADPAPKFIEFFVPYRLMCCEVDQWPYKIDDAMPFARPLGTEFPVVIRSHDRRCGKTLRDMLKKRWPLAEWLSAPAGTNVGISWLEDLQQDETQLFETLRRGDRAPCLVLGVPVGCDAYKIWQTSVWAGVSIGLWLRAGPQNPPDLRAQLSVLLTGSPAPGSDTCPIEVPSEALRDLPQRVYLARQQHPKLYSSLTLCWDDPYRLPPEAWLLPPPTA